MEPGTPQLNISTASKPILAHLSSFSLAAIRKYRALLHLCRPWPDFCNASMLSFTPPKNGSGEVDIKLLYQRFRINMTSYKYNYIVASFGPLALVTVWYWNVLFSVLLSMGIFGLIMSVSSDVC